MKFLFGFLLILCILLSAIYPGIDADIYKKEQKEKLEPFKNRINKQGKFREQRYYRNGEQRPRHST